MELTVQPALAEVGSTVTAHIDIVEAVDLAGFDFWLEYDAERLSFAGAELGEFLGSTSRSVFPLGPNVEDGRVGYGAFSLPGAPAPNGSGRIAVLQFEVTAPGVSTLDLGEATTVDSRQESSPAGGASTTIEGRGTAPEIDLFVPFATRR